jgi:alkylation response protein AidB-like acyl-CoA dehydrogenase
MCWAWGCAVDLEFSPEQALLQSSLDKLLAKYRQAPTHDVAYAHYSQDLRNELDEGGFLGIALQEGFGPLDAALLIEAVARVPWSVEVAASSLMSYALGRELDGPVALCEGLGRPTRYLPQAKHALILTSDGMRLAAVEANEVPPSQNVLAYPVGTLAAMPRNSELLGADVAAKVHNTWRIAIAAEAAGLMRGALDLTVAYVKDRKQFNRPLGDFQAIQHRLSACEQIVSASYLLALRAADSLNPEDAATAALYAQQHMRQVIYDCHQFTGAMGVTLEYPLHLWTYRLKFLQGERGGYAAQAATLAEMIWGADA